MGAKNHKVGSPINVWQSLGNVFINQATNLKAYWDQVGEIVRVKHDALCDYLEDEIPTNVDLSAHTTRVDNPHAVTKTQVDLGNVDNTADIDKPVSTAQANAISVVEVAKANLASPTFTGEPKAPNMITGGSSQQIANRKYVDDTVVAIGAGDMAKAVYDKNNSGVVDNSERLEGKTAAELTPIYVNNLTSTDTNKGLSAAQGKILNEKIDERTQESCIVTLSTDDAQSVVGQKITLINVTAATTEEYTLGTGENSHTFKIAQNQIYKIKANAKVGDYTTPSETGEFTAIASNIRNVAMIYEKMHRYGFKREKTDANPSTRITYLYDAIGKTPAYMDFATGEFNFGSWKNFTEEVSRPVMLKTNKTVDYELSRSDMTKKADGVTASDISNTSYDGNAMIELRKWKWVYRYEDSTHEYVIFSNDRYSVDYEAYAHENELGSVNNAFYWGAFKGSNVSSKLRSLAGQTIMVNQTRNTEVSYATANGSGHYTIYKSGWDYICDLLTLISKSDNGQASFGQGRNGASNALATGTLKDKPMFMGYDNATSDVKVFGIEGFWGNVWEGMAGLVLNGKIKTKMTPPYNFDGTGYLDTGVIPNGTSGGYVSAASVTGESGYVPKTASGSATQYYCDGLWFNNSIVGYALVGGDWSAGFLGGPRSVALDGLASRADARVGSRLSFLDPA